MRLTCLVLAGLFAAAAIAEPEKPSAAEALGMLDKATTFDLYSLDPSVRNDKEGFHGWKVLGKTTVKDADTRKALAAAFRKGVEDNKGVAAACFNPHHGLRFTSEGKTVDLVICFECFQVQQYTNDKMDKGFLVTGSPQAVFDKTLKDAGVELPKAAIDK